MPTNAIVKRVEVSDLVRMDKERIEFSAAITEAIGKEVAKSQATVVKVDCYQDTVDAGAIKAVLKALCKQMNDKRLECGRAIKEFKEGWDEFFNDPCQSAIAEVERITGLEREYNDYLEEENRKAEAKRRAEIEKREKLQAAHEAKGHQIDEVPRAALVPEVIPVKTQTATRTKKFWTWDKANYDLSKIPREYLIPDNGKITAAVKSGIREIPGVRIYQDTSVL